MKIFYIDLSKEYFKDSERIEKLEVIHILLGLLWGLCAIPSQTIKYSVGENPYEFVFTVKCYKEHMDKFCKEVREIFPDIEKHMRVEVYEQK